MQDKSGLRNSRMTISCTDCKDNHKCGIECKSICCFDEHCGCAATEIISGLYSCDVCKLVVCREDRGFRQYLEAMQKWYDVFYAKNETYLKSLQQKALSEIPMTEQETKNYEAVNAFCDAKSDFSMEILGTIQLDTISRRKIAYTLIQAFEEIKEIQL